MGAIWRACFGRAPRRAVFDYMQVVTLIMLILLAIAWTIDLAQHFPDIRNGAEKDGVAMGRILLPYLSYRSADMIVRMFPMACFFGVFIAELLRRYRLDSVILISAGASPIRLMGAVLVFAALGGMLQQFLEQRGRPMAVAAQVELGYGSYAHRFHPHLSGGHFWFMAGDTTLRARIYRGNPPALHDVLVFTGVQQPELDKIYGAKKATPANQAGLWKLEDVQIWQDGSGKTAPEEVDSVELDLTIIPEQVVYYGIPGFYLPDPVVHRLQTVTHAIGTRAGAEVAIWKRRTAWALPGVFALLAMLLAQFGFSGRQPNIPRTIALAAFGYISVVSLKVFWEIGEMAAVPAWFAINISIFGVLAICSYLLWRLS